MNRIFCSITYFGDLLRESNLNEETQKKYRQFCLDNAIIINCYAIPYKNVYKNVKSYYDFIDMDIFKYSFEKLKTKRIKDKITYIIWKMHWTYGLYMFYKSLSIIRKIKEKFLKKNNKEEFRKIS